MGHIELNLEDRGTAYRRSAVTAGGLAAAPGAISVVATKYPVKPRLQHRADIRIFRETPAAVARTRVR